MDVQCLKVKLKEGQTGIRADSAESLVTVTFRGLLRHIFFLKTLIWHVFSGFCYISCHNRLVNNHSVNCIFLFTHPEAFVQIKIA